MKYNYTRIAVVFGVVVSMLASCKKSEVKTTTKSPTNDEALSGRIAVDLYKSITGQFGGANIKSGIKAPSNLAVDQKGPVINSISPLCGFVIDTSYNNTVSANDTTKNLTGNFHFVYTCSADIPDGYIVRDSITNTFSGANFSNLYTVAQDYKVQALDKTYKTVSMNGYNYTLRNNRVLQGQETLGFDYIYSGYKLLGMVVDVSGGVPDVISGTSTFYNMEYKDLPGGPIDGSETASQGSITFLGHHEAKITISNHSYLVNLLTGAVTQIN